MSGPRSRWPAPATPARAGLALAIALLVVLAHLGLLREGGPRPAQSPAPPRPAVLARQIPPPDRPAPDRTPQPAIEPPPRKPAQAPRPAVVQAPALDAGAATGAAPAADALPVYPTRLPPAQRLRYRLGSGGEGGVLDLDWQPGADGRYRLALEVSRSDRPGTTRLSLGRLDDHGLAPERYTDQRGRRAARAVNFERDAGWIGFSGPGHRLAWAPGVQDGLSWIVQLAAVVEADPARRVPGAGTRLQVVGAHGLSEPWSFEVHSATDGPPGTLYLRREPARAYDQRAEVWLDPQRHHLPVRVRLTTPERGESTDWTLER